MIKPHNPLRIIVCVTNDISTDRRVGRIATSLGKISANVLVIGRKYPGTLPKVKFGFSVYRFSLWFNKGACFYAEYNLRLFFRLLFSQTGLLVANDLDTLPAVYLASKIRRIPVVYDSHEYFTEVPELIGRRTVKKIWETIEAIILPHLRYTSTVSASIAAEYHQKYGIDMQVIRNLPRYHKTIARPVQKNKSETIIYQGSLNVGRGLEMAIKAMLYLDDVRLVIAGTGDIECELKELALSLALGEKVSFIGRIPPDELVAITARADVGISLEEKLGLNYFYALPNKLFDYIQARIPVLVSDLPEMKAVVNTYQIGCITRTANPLELAITIREMLDNQDNISKWKSNLEIAASELCWENEEESLLIMYRKALQYK